MPTLNDLAQRLFAAHQRTFMEQMKTTWHVDADEKRWDDIPPEAQECWVAVAAEAVKAGVELRKELDAATWTKIEQEWTDLRTSIAQMVSGDGLVYDPDTDTFSDLSDTAPKLRELADQSRKFARDCE